jgi:DNA-binding phage protein
MKNQVINNGAFTAAGNFSGYTALGNRIHIHGRQMTALGWSGNEDVSFPFYCITKDAEIKELDSAGKETGNVSIRETALSVFKTREDINRAHIDSATLDMEIKKNIAEEAAKVGLSKESIDSLLSASV